MKAILGLLVAMAVLVGGGLGLWYWQERNHTGTAFRTAAVERGTVWATISATGTVMPEERIDVGAQVAGQIKAFGRDPRDSSRPIDFCSVVEEGTVLAQLDDTLFKARVAQARANLQKAEAEMEQAQARLLQAERDWERARRLGSQRAVSGLDFDTVQANYESAKALVAVAKANVAQAQAALQEAEINLGYTTIRSPVKGVIIERKVNVGQTVVANLNAPSLFIIATDLTRMQVWAAVNEADIGNIYPGQAVQFTVDSRPGETFTGVVYQIRLNATTTQNVVIYTVVVNTDNSHGKLLPNQTANLLFDVQRRENVLVVPNSALRWRPQLHLVVPEAREEYARLLRRKAAAAAGRSGEDEAVGRGYLWVEEDGLVRPIPVRTGITDGTVTEIVAGDISEGTLVVTGEVGSGNNEQTVNPFTPQFNRNKQQQ
ncbi:MAG TPA: efflux RND transporter periplasmic adaptor subunit [Gemmataceae bacterium]|nr:efflux RND transporter periplasmic adaptor subunit [Gemmataceae bacterium]